MELTSLIQKRRAYRSLDPAPVDERLISDLAGFDEDKVKETLEIPEQLRVITLLIVGKHADNIGPELSEKQVAWEKELPERLPQERFVFHNRYIEREAEEG